MNFVEGLIEIIVKYRGELASSMLLTLQITALSFLIGLLLGLAISIGRTHGPFFVKAPLIMYIEVIRGTPMLVQLFFVYYALPIFGIRLDPYTASVLAIGLNSAAYQAEYFRMAFGAIPREQWEAALSIGLSRWSTLVNIIIPQGVRIAVPALTNEAIYLLKYSSIAYFVTVPELVYVSRVIGSRTLLYLQIYTISALFYIAVAFTLTKIASVIERRAAIPGLVVKQEHFA